MRHAAWLLSLAALACTAQIPDGRIRCASGACPAGFSCWPDQLCRRLPARDASTDAATDAFVADAELDAFVPPVDAWVEVDAAAPIDAASASCMTNAACTAPAVCLAGRWPGGSLGTCVDPSTPLPPNEGMACGDEGECAAPDACLGGACVRPCVPGPGNPMCVGGENCAPAPPTTPSISESVCLAPCETSCTNAAFECVRPPMAPRATCFPIVWAVPRG